MKGSDDQIKVLRKTVGFPFFLCVIQKLFLEKYKTIPKVKFDINITWQIKSTFNSNPKKERYFQFVDFFFFETTKPCAFPPICICDLITSFYARLTPKWNWSLCLRSQKRCYAQNPFWTKILDFLFIDTTKNKSIPAFVVVLFDETLTNLIDLSYLVPKPPFGANLMLISSLVLELLITHKKEGLWNFWT